MPPRSQRAAPSSQAPAWPALATSEVAAAFGNLQVSAALWVPGDVWHVLYGVSDIQTFEYEYGVDARRWPYNHHHFAEVMRTRKAVRGQHAGFHDVFVPVCDATGVRGVLSAGPFALTRPTGVEVLQRWFWLTGQPGHLGDPSFSHYLSVTLSTLTLEGSLVGAFDRLVGAFAGLLGGEGSVAALAAEAQSARAKLAEARFVDRMWRAARSMINERDVHRWIGPSTLEELQRMALVRVPQHVVVGLLVGPLDERDPVDDLLRRHAFQRASVALARRVGRVACGPIGDHGVFLLVDDSGARARTRARLGDLATKLAATARRYGFSLRSGISHGVDPTLLPTCYRAALWAAEKALSDGISVVYGDPKPMPAAKQLRELRNQLAESVLQGRSALSTRFDQYIEAVLVHCGYRLEPTRAHLESGLERLGAPLLATGALDEKSFDEMFSAMERAADSAETTTAMVVAYRRLVAEIEAALRAPATSRQDRSLDRALRYVRDHLNESLDLPTVSKVAGFAPNYFSKLVKHRQGVTFEASVQRLRVERSMQMLAGGSLGIDGIAQLCGFKTRNYFHRVFKRVVGITPAEYRERGARAREA